MQSSVPQFLICSKGRAGKSTTDRLLEEIPVDYAFVVEPQDVNDYKRCLKPHGSVISLPMDNQGLPYSREFTKNLASSVHKHFVMLDDDIISFSTVKEGKTKKCSPSVLIEAFDVFKDSGLAMMSFEYQQFAWSQKQKFSIGKACDCCVFFNAEKTASAHYDKSVVMKEDLDFCIQVAMLGGKIGRYNRIAISVPSLGSNDGGLSALYKAGEDDRSAIRLYKKWGPKICKLVRKKNGRLDCKIDFKKFFE